MRIIESGVNVKIYNIMTDFREKNNLTPTAFLFGMTIILIYFCNNSYFSIQYHYSPIIFAIIISSLCRSIRRNTFRINSISLFLFLFIILVVFSSIITYIKNDKNIKLEWHSFVSMLVVLTFVISSISDIYNKKSIRFIITGYIVSVTALSLLVLIFQEPFATVVSGVQIRSYETRYSVKYLNNIYIDPNFLAMYLLSGTLFSFIRGFMYKGYIYRISYFTIGVVNTIVIFLTGSRAAFLALCVGMFFIFLNIINNITDKNSKIYIIAFIIIIMTILVIFLFFSLDEYYIDRFLNFESYNDASNTGRLEVWIYGLKIGLWSPVWGHGSVLSRNIIYNTFNLDKAAHNTYIEYWIQGGFAGILCILSVLFITFKNCLKRERRVLLGTFLAIVITSVIVAAQVSLAFWIPIIILIICNNYLNANKYATLSDII